MIFSAEEIEKILGSDFVLDCSAIRLMQKKDGAAKEYQGPGSIFQDRDGRLRLKMYHSFSPGYDISGELTGGFFGSGLSAGKIIDDEFYYSLEAIDFSGRVWTSDYIWVSGNTSFVVNAKLIEADLKDISNESKRNGVNGEPRIRAHYIIPGDYKFPCNKSERSEGGVARSLCEMDSESFKLTMKKREGWMELAVENCRDSRATDFVSLLLEAVSIGLGRYLRPVIQAVVYNGSIVNTIFSKGNEGDEKSLAPPIPVRLPTDSLYLKEFIEQYLQVIDEPLSPLFGYWYRVLSGESGELENRALVLTTAIEGVLKEYYSGHGLPDQDFISQIGSAIDLVKKGELGERIRSRLLSNLGHAKSATPKGALLGLAKEKLIQGDLVGIWTELRNQSAHADQLKRGGRELQRFLDKNYACLELFYALLLNHLKYCGSYIQYSVHGWPDRRRHAAEELSS